MATTSLFRDCLFSSSRETIVQCCRIRAIVASAMSSVQGLRYLCIIKIYGVHPMKSLTPFVAALSCKPSSVQPSLRPLLPTRRSNFKVSPAPVSASAALVPSCCARRTRTSGGASHPRSTIATAKYDTETSAQEPTTFRETRSSGWRRNSESSPRSERRPSARQKRWSC